MNNYPMSNEVIHHVLSCGGGVDTTTMFSMHLYRDEAAHWLGITREELDKHLPYFTACVFSDTGSEYPWTYENIDLIKQFCEFHGIVFKQVSRGDYFNDDKSLFEFLTRIGSIPVLPGAHHTCSLKFKVEPLRRWAEDTYGDEPYTWTIGFAAGEGYRKDTFDTREMKNTYETHFPLMDKALGVTREDGIRWLEHIKWPYDSSKYGLPRNGVQKSACAWCPFNQVWELETLVKFGDTVQGKHNMTLLEEAKTIESRFAENSPVKHQRWIDAGMPFVGRCKHCNNCGAKNPPTAKKDPCECGNYDKCNIKIMEHDHRIQKEYGWDLTEISQNHDYSGIRRAPKNMWKFDYYNDEEDPARLITRRIDGLRIGIEEWEEYPFE